MKIDREYSDYLDDILDAIQKAADFVGDMFFEQFSKDDKTVFAVIRALEIVGEASTIFPIGLKQTILKFHGERWPVSAIS